jgi:PhzF family phenazine biosynthesis protein
MRLRFKQVDVFTAEAFRGNPVAVVFGADGLADEEMQTIASWMNLSETAFIQRSTRADYRLRIFTPRYELPFAGHPTVGSAHAIREADGSLGTRDSLVQECGAGLVPIAVDARGDILARVPTPKILATKIDARELRAAVGDYDWSDPLVIDVGPKWMVARLESYDALYDLSPDVPRLTDVSRETDTTGINAYALDSSNRVHVRSFAPAAGVVEDPVCGSGNAAVGAHVRATGLDAVVGGEYVAHQGRALGRDGEVRVRLNGVDVYIGGSCVTAIDGQITLQSHQSRECQNEPTEGPHQGAQGSA